VSKRDKLLEKIILGESDNNISFDSLCNLLEFLGFELRIRGSHHIFIKEGIPETINIQPQDGKVKSYQVAQIRAILIEYELGR
jgi:predicted RNA binding protein YcfA (HicA-like mRNA interferase family)